MTAGTRSVALLAGNPAFAAILCRALEELGGLRVGAFADAEALTTFLRIAPVDAVVLDGELAGTPVAKTVRALRAHPRLATPDFALVVLTRAAGPFHGPLLAAGADAVLEKPVLPQRVCETIEALAGRARLPAAASYQPPPARRPVRPMPAIVERRDNVVPLFGPSPQRA